MSWSKLSTHASLSFFVGDLRWVADSPDHQYGHHQAVGRAAITGMTAGMPRVVSGGETTGDTHIP